MDNNGFPTLEDIKVKIPEPIYISCEGDWLGIGIGSLGMILQYTTEPETLRWLGQVTKFSPQASYYAAKTITELLKRQNVTAKWQSVS